MKTKKIKNAGLLILAVLICQAAGFIGSIFTSSSIESWYQFLVKPPLNPPNWLFGPVWFLLYTLMGIALYLIWKQGFKKQDVKTALKIFLVHLIFNASWSVVFFGMENTRLALVNIIWLWVLIVILIFKFYKIKRAAAYLLLPYLLWVSFATYLNLFIIILN